MYAGLKQTHYTLMVILLVLLVFTVGRFFINWRSGKPFSKFENTQTLLVTILAHLQLVLGFALYFTGPWFGQLSSMGEVMKDSTMRLLVVEHPLTMLIGIVLITIGRAKVKRLELPAQKYRSVVIFFGIALVLIVLRIPWALIG